MNDKQKAQLQEAERSLKDARQHVQNVLNRRAAAEQERSGNEAAQKAIMRDIAPQAEDEYTARRDREREAREAGA